MKLVKTHRKKGDIAHVHESVSETDLVPSLVCLLFVRSSSVSPPSRLQVSVSGFAPTHRDKGECLGHNMARLGVTAELFWRSSSTQNWGRMSRWERQPRWEGQRDEERRERHPWRTHEGLEESNSGDK